MRIDWAPEVLRAAGLVVEELPGWRGRGRDLARVTAVVNHGFGARYEDGWTDTAFDRMLVSGRPDLAGPLAQLGVDRDGHLVMVADGRCNHNGLGRFGNNAIGIEAYGRDSWTAAQITSWKVANAALLNRLGYAADRCWGHKETDPDRKPDPIGIDLSAFRADVGLYQHQLAHHDIGHREDDMPYRDWPAEDKVALTKDVAAAVIALLGEKVPTTLAGERLLKAARGGKD